MLFDWQDGRICGKSSPVPARVSRSRKRVKAADLVTQGTYGPVRTPSYVISAQKSAWESRLMGLLGTCGSTERELIWKQQITPSGQSYYQLAVSTPRHAVIAGGGLPAGLQAEGKLWSGLRASDGEKGGPGQKFGAGGMPLPAEVVMVADQWPAVRANRRGCPDSHGVDTVNLVACQELWPVVTARDWRSDSSQKPGEQIYGTKGKPLARTALEVSGTATPGPSDPTGTANPGSSKPGGCLNPIFAAWLQGYPRAHLNCAPSYSPKAKARAHTK